MKRMKSQQQEILGWLTKGFALTSLEALNLFGCMRLAAVIHMLKKKGYRIVTKIINDGERRYAQYRLVNE